VVKSNHEKKRERRGREGLPNSRSRAKQWRKRNNQLGVIKKEVDTQGWGDGDDHQKHSREGNLLFVEGWDQKKLMLIGRCEKVNNLAKLRKLGMEKGGQYFPVGGVVKRTCCSQLRRHHLGKKGHLLQGVNEVVGEDSRGGKSLGSERWQVENGRLAQKNLALGGGHKRPRRLGVQRTEAGKAKKRTSILPGGKGARF